MSENQPVVTALDNGVFSITLNRPDKLNAFNAPMSEAFLAALISADKDVQVRSVLITGAGRAFCAGQDLGDRDPRKMSEPPDLGHTIETYYNPAIRRIRSMHKPIICAVNGVAAGAGANIALACDLVLAARSAKFIQAFAKIGLIPDSGGTWTLTRLIGEARAKALTMTAEPLSADTAEQWGLIFRSVDDDALVSESEALAAKMAIGPTKGLGLIKQSIHSASDNSLDEQLDLERDFQRIAGRSDDYAEGVTAFLDKRPAVFKGH